MPIAQGVTVALPVHQAARTLRQAFECIVAQTLRDLEILVVLNGADTESADLARALVSGDPRARIIELEHAGLPAALNTALEAARFPLVARMDADDLCPPPRLAMQAAFMLERPEVAALGTAWELASADGQVITVVRPPCEPGRLRWRLLLGNLLAHGSMMLRRDLVLAAGGYDTACVRAQDYDLWLRLATRHDLACLPDVLYRHRARFPDDPGRSTREQADVAGARQLAAWRALAPGPDPATERAIVSALSRHGAPAESIDAIEHALDERPTTEGLLAWLWAQWFHPPAPRRIAEACRASRIREVGRRLRDSGVEAVWLWGAGDHTRRMLESPATLGLRVAGLVDDAVAGQRRFGHDVRPPADLRPGEVALISSDWHEDTIWASSAPHRARGVRVFRLYLDPA